MRPPHTHYHTHTHARTHTIFLPFCVRPGYGHVGLWSHIRSLRSPASGSALRYSSQDAHVAYIGGKVVSRFRSVGGSSDGHLKMEFCWDDVNVRDGPCDTSGGGAPIPKQSSHQKWTSAMRICFTNVSNSNYASVLKTVDRKNAELSEHGIVKHLVQKQIMPRESWYVSSTGSLSFFNNRNAQQRAANCVLLTGCQFLCRVIF